MCYPAEFVPRENFRPWLIFSSYTCEAKFYHCRCLGSKLESGPRMQFLKRTLLFATVAVGCTLPQSLAIAQEERADTNPTSARTTYKIAPTSLNVNEARAAMNRRNNHPLLPLLELGSSTLQHINNNIHDYKCILIKRERILDELRPYEYVAMKFRGHRPGDGSPVPYSVYAKVLAPKSIKGRQVLYVDGEFGGDVLVTKGGRRNNTMTFSIRPEGRLAMRDNKYPVTAFGFENLLVRVMEVAENDLQYDECQVRTVAGAKVDDRICTMYEVVHPFARDHFIFHIARIFLDDERQLPIRFEAYTWPEVAGGEPVLVEEYTFRDLQINVGLTDADFAHDNPQYNFHLSDEEE